MLPAISLAFITLLLLLLLRCQLFLWGSPLFFFSFSSALPAFSLGFTILLLLFLRCQLCVWDSPFFCLFFSCVASDISGVHSSSSSSSSAFPSYILSGVHHFGSEFRVCDRFLNPTIEVATFRLRGWCMQCVFLLSVFTYVGHEYHDHAVCVFVAGIYLCRT